MEKSESKWSAGACDSGEGNSSDSSSNNSSSEEDDPADESRRRRLRKFARKKDMMALLSRNKCYAGREGQDSFDAWITQFEQVMGPSDWTVLSMGLSNSGASLQRLMQHVLRPTIRRSCHSYLDDILVFRTAGKNTCPT